MSKVVDETGHQYGDLTVIKRAGSKSGKAAWECKCSCGKIVICTGDDLRRGNRVSCGCKAKERMKKIGKQNAINIAGQRFGKLIALERIENYKNGKSYWKCICDCGNIHYADYSNLIRGNVKSCGCLVSYGEFLIQQFLTKKGISFKTQFTPDGWKLKSSYQPFFDFAVFDNEDNLKFLLEFNGEQHRKFYSNRNTWNNKENFLKVQERDKQKQQLCKENNIPLYIIWYNESLEEKLNQILEKENLT